MLYGCKIWTLRSLTILAFYSYGAETIYHPWNYSAASALEVYRHCSCKEGSTGLVSELIKVPTVSLSRTYFCPHRLILGAGDLEAS